MTDEVLVRLKNVGKQFSKGFEHSHRTLAKELTSLFWGRKPSVVVKNDPEAFWALQDVSFEIRRGEVLGVLGHNGAGKTTLLRMLNGEMEHDSGELEVLGQRSSLIDLTGGFSFSMTGRENIYFRGAHLGFDREFLRQKEAEIVDFTELGDFIDSPIKTYSSGMLLRLGFAVTVFSDPDVLLVDEVLAVGDFLFATKCMRKLNELKRRAALVYVTHAMESTVNFADRVLVLDRGAPVFLGNPSEAVSHYIRLEEAKDRLGTSRLARGGVTTVIEEVAPPEESAVEESVPEEMEVEIEETASVSPAPIVLAEDPATAFEDVEGADSGVLMAKMAPQYYNPDAIADIRVWWCNEDRQTIDSFTGSDVVHLCVSFTALERITRLTVGIPIWSADGVYVTCFATHARPIEQEVAAGATHTIMLRINSLHFNKGLYYPVVAILNSGEFLYRQPGPILRVSSNRATLGWGLVTLDYDWRP